MPRRPPAPTSRAAAAPTSATTPLTPREAITLPAPPPPPRRPSPPGMALAAPTPRAAVADLEDRGAASLWVGGHVASRNPSPEPMVWLARLFEQTSRTIVGTATLLLPLYPPGIVAKQLADLDRASNGRLAIGVGVGGEYTSDFD